MTKSARTPLIVCGALLAASGAALVVTDAFRPVDRVGLVCGAIMAACGAAIAIIAARLPARHAPED